jgi:hypothetical protein
MAARSPQTFAKRAREQAVKEKRELKRQRKAEAAAMKAEGIEVPVEEHDAENLNDPRNTSDAVVETGRPAAPPAE